MVEENPGIVVVTTDTGLLQRVQLLVRDMGADVYWEKDLDSLLELFQENTFELVIVPSTLFLAQDTDGPRIIDKLAEVSSSTRILFLIGTDEDRRHFAHLKCGTFRSGRIDSSDISFCVSPVAAHGM